MSDEQETFGEYTRRNGISRRAFIQFCAATAASLALPAGQGKLFAEALAAAPRPTVIWQHFQECTGCSESLTRSFTPTVEDLILNSLSLDYHETLMAAAGERAEAARVAAMAQAYGRYVLVIEGSVSTIPGYSVVGGADTLTTLREAVAGAALVVAVGTCAAFGGLARARPSPSRASGVRDLMNASVIASRPLLNISGCPPIGEAITGSIAYFLAYGRPPETDKLRRPKTYYATEIHDKCPRKEFYGNKQFANAFDDAGARAGWCLWKLGCRGPVTHSACVLKRYNGNTSYPIYSGHGCTGCTEPNFWDLAASFYTPVKD